MKVDLIRWPDSQGCIGCQHAALVMTNDLNKEVDSTYVCLAEDRSKVLCDNPEML